MARRDPVTPDVAVYVLNRDFGCVAPRLGLPHACEGRLELDHVDNGGHGRRGPSSPDNLVSLCSLHHRYKTEHARACRPTLRSYIERAEARLRRVRAGD